jgi:serine-type D-Ala-D-Ala carboxypeptidase/endopeptidase (penicillin-binding protein 4)
MASFPAHNIMTGRWFRFWVPLLLGTLIPLSQGTAPEAGQPLSTWTGTDRVEPGLGVPDEASLLPVSSRPTATAAAPAARIALDGLLRTGSGSERWAVQVISLDHGDTLFSRRADASMAPASNLKLYTSAAALHVLGPEFRFPTYLLARGTLEDGVLRGDLILYGTGDPTFGTPEPDTPSAAVVALLEALSVAGIRRVEGRVLGDGTFYTGAMRRPSWQARDLNEWFAAPASALTFNENMVTLRVQATRPEGFPGAVVTSPAHAGIPFWNETRIQRSGPGMAMTRSHPDGPVRISGSMRPGQPDVWRSMTVSNPPAYAASVFRAALLSAGIPVTGGSEAVGSRQEPASSISGGAWFAPRAQEGALPLWSVGVVHSPPVRDLIHRVNRQSHNLYSELLLLAMGRAEGNGSDFDAGLTALRSFLVDAVGVDGQALHLEDGSGLSRLNRTTAADLVRALHFMENSPHRAAFLASLPAAGGPRSRELGRMARTPAEGNLQAKTGTIHRTSALSGVVRTADGERLLFSILVNDVPSPWAAKQVEDRVGVQLASFQRQRGILSDTGRPGTSLATLSVDEDRP